MTIKLRWPTLAETGCGIVLLLVAVAILYPIMYPYRDGHPRQHSCLVNVRLLAHGLLQYAVDYDERLPNALEWPTVLAPYVRDQGRTLHCPDNARWVEAKATLGPRSYDMLQKFSYRSLASMEPVASTIAFYEIGDAGVAYRHNGGMNLGFMDGHAKWCSTSQVPPHVLLTGALKPRPPAPFP